MRVSAMQANTASHTQQPQAAPAAMAAVTGKTGSTVLMELLSNSYHTLTETVHRDNLDVLHELSSHQLSEPVAR